MVKCGLILGNKTKYINNNSDFLLDVNIAHYDMLIWELFGKTFSF